jgi:hypothetical protein
VVLAGGVDAVDGEAAGEHGSTVKDGGGGGSLLLWWCGGVRIGDSPPGVIEVADLNYAWQTSLNHVGDGKITAGSGCLRRFPRNRTARLRF